jgi:hypothetical protein
MTLTPISLKAKKWNSYSTDTNEGPAPKTQSLTNSTNFILLFLMSWFVSLTHKLDNLHPDNQQFTVLLIQCCISYAAERFN